MLCRRCLTHARGLAGPSNINIQRTLTTSAPVRTANATKSISANAATTAAGRQGSSPHTHPAATSTAAAQPFSTPLAPSPAALGIKAVKNKDVKKEAPVLVQSSVAAGTVLKGLNFEKGKSDPLAGEDAEYPAWLWGVLRRAEAGSGVGADEGLFSKSKKQRRLAAKRLRRQERLQGTMEPPVPLYEQSVDLTAGDGSLEGNLAAEAARNALTKAMRAKRRGAIKEDNFLRAMG